MWFAVKLALYSLSILGFLFFILGSIATIDIVIQYRNLLSSAFFTDYLPLVLALAFILAMSIGIWITARAAPKSE